MTLRKQKAHALGVEAERKCAEFLQAKGYEIIGMRVRTEGGELDIVARKDDILAVVEVKARRSHAESLYAVTPAKQKRLAQGARALLAQIAGLGDAQMPNIRFDVMALAADGAPFHLEDAWRPDEEFA
jgi:putative endonuclease